MYPNIFIHDMSTGGMGTGSSISKSEHCIIAVAVNCLFMVPSKLLNNPGFIIDGYCCMLYL